MGINPDALFSCLTTDIEPYLSLGGVSQAAAESIRTSFYKKFVDKENPDAEQLALDKFLSINDRMRNFDMSGFTDEQLIFIGTLKDVLAKWVTRSGLDSLTFGDLLDCGRVGPGASIGARGQDFYTKLFDSPLSCTKAPLLTVYRQYIQSCPRWFSAEIVRASNRGNDLIVEGNSLSFVAKTNVIRRTICTEPNINMFYQLGLGSLIEGCLDSQVGIDLGIQPEKNRELARLGSSNQSFGTIDLESASDSLSLGMIEAVVPRSLWSWLRMLRSPCTRYRGQVIPLNMVSTMGNGFTFPLQTLLFAGVVVATAKIAGYTLCYPKLGRLGNFGVFGDDIIVAECLYDKTVTNLETLGFRVNLGKSFNTGPFRESCGHDYYQGFNIRGVYAKSISTVQDRFVLLNRLLDFTARTGIPVRNVSQALLKTVPDYPVPLAENDDAGLRVPYSFVRRRVLDRNTQSIRYKRWVAKPIGWSLSAHEERIRVTRGMKARSFNYDGLLLSFLRGGLTSNWASSKSGQQLVGYRCSVRLDWVRYSQKIGVSPNWDFMPMGLGVLTPRVGLGQLETAYLLNCEVE